MKQEERLAALAEAWERERLAGRELSATEVCANDAELVPTMLEFIERKRRIEELIDRWEQAAIEGAAPSVNELCKSSPELIPYVEEEIAALRSFQARYGDLPQTTLNSANLKAFCGDRYQIQDYYESGGLGVLYKAVDKELGRAILVKTVLPHVGLLENTRRTFEREAQITGQLEHPGIVPVYGFGRDETGRPYYAMKFVRGETLTCAIQRFHAASPGKIWHERAIEFHKLLGSFVAVCRTIAFAHSRCIVHRDLKPDNIMLGDYGEVLVIDWGLAKTVEETDSAHASSQRSLSANAAPFVSREAVKGTPAYMSPEQAAGGNSVGVASDIFSLGATLFELLSGQRPFSDQSTEAILGHLQAGEIPRLGEVKSRLPGALIAICEKAMCALPEQRYADSESLALDIERYLADEPVIAWREPTSMRIGRFLRRRRFLVAGAGIAVMATLIVVSISAGLLAAKQRQLSKLNEALTNQNREMREAAYVKEFLLAKSAWSDGNFARAKMLLDHTDPDLRGIEWTELSRHLACKESPLTESAVIADQLNTTSLLPSVFHADLSRDGVLCAIGAPQIIDMSDASNLADRLSKPGWTIAVRELRTDRRLREFRGAGFLQSVRFSADKQFIGAIVEPIPTGYRWGDKIREAAQKASEASSRLQQKFLDSARSSAGVRERLLEQLQHDANPSDVDKSLPTSPRLPDFGENPSTSPPPKTPREVAGSVQAKPVDGAVLEYRAWNTITGEELSTPSAAEFRRRFTSELEDSKVEVEQISSNVLKVMSRLDGAPSEKIIDAGAPVEAFSLSDDHETLVTATGDRSIRLWNVRKGREFAEAPSRTAGVRLVRLTHDPKQLIWLGADGVLRELALESRSKPKHKIKEQSSNEVLALVQLKEKEQIAILDRAGEVHVIDLQDESELRRWQIPIAGPLSNSAEVAFSPDGGKLAIVEQGNCRIFSMESHQSIGEPIAVGSAPTFSADGNTLSALSTTAQQGVILMDALRGSTREVIDFREFTLLGEDISGESLREPSGSYALAPSGKSAIVLAKDGLSIHFLDLKRRKFRTHSLREAHSRAGANRVFYGVADEVLLTIDAATFDCHVWRTSDWKLTATLKGHGGDVTSVRHSGDQRRFLTASVDGVVRLWDSKSGWLLWSFRGEQLAPVRTALISDNNNRIIAIGENEILQWSEPGAAGDSRNLNF